MYDDLEGSDEQTLNNGAPLTLTHIDRYLQGPTQDASVLCDLSVGELQHSWMQLKRESNSWISGNHIPRQPTSSLVSPAAAVSALGELTPGGVLMKGFREDSLGREYIFINLKILHIKYDKQLCQSFRVLLHLHFIT